MCPLVELTRCSADSGHFFSRYKARAILPGDTKVLHADACLGTLASDCAELKLSIAVSETRPWVRMTSRNSGRSFYYNRRTGISSNTAPMQEEIDEEESAEEVKTSPLPAEWIRRTSARWGRTYYFNVRSFESRWTRPTTENRGSNGAL